MRYIGCLSQIESSDLLKMAGELKDSSNAPGVGPNARTLLEVFYTALMDEVTNRLKA